MFRPEKMETIMVNDKITVNVIGIDDEKEVKEYIEHCMKKHGESLLEVTIRRDPEDNDFVYISCMVDRPFERIRRITGYLVGTLDSFNDAKRAEERNRVKHDM